MNRIDAKFKELKARKKKAFIAYITAGYPDMKATEALVSALAAAGADIIELGVPFSDPMADGPTIQQASFRSLQRGTTLTKILEAVRRLRKITDVPIALMTYYNPVHYRGTRSFVAEAKAAGVDGLIVPDLPLEESAELQRAGRSQDLAVVSFLAPTTPEARVKSIVRSATGFIYFVSVTGVTGARQQVPAAIARQVKRARALTATPVCVGFGVSTPEQVRSMAAFSDGVIVGSAIIKEIDRFTGAKDMPARVAAFVRTLSRPLNS